MKARWMPVLGGALTALAVWGLFTLSAALPAGGYGLRFAEPLAAAQAQALEQAAAQQGVDLALWREEDARLTTPLGRSAGVRLVYTTGSPALCFPVEYVRGTAPGAAQADGCAVSTALADALFGSRAVAGLTLDLPGGRRTITGVLQSEQKMVLCPAASGAGATGAELGCLPAADPRGAVQQLLQGAGVGQGAQYLPYGTLGGVLAALGWLPVAAAGLLLALRLWQSLPLRGGGRQAAGFLLALGLALALPALLGALPRWLIPSRWADAGFWTGLAEMLGQSLDTLLHLPDTARDARLAAALPRAAACLAALLAGLPPLLTAARPAREKTRNASRGAPPAGSRPRPTN